MMPPVVLQYCLKDATVGMQHIAYSRPDTPTVVQECPETVFIGISEWCKLFLRAASAADRMQGSLRRASTDDMSDLECMDTPSGT